MAMLGNCSTAPCSAPASTRQRQLLHFITGNLPASPAACRQHGSVISRQSSAPQHHSCLHGQVKQVVIAQRSLRTQAAAQETVALEEPVLEFLGVNNGMQTVRGVMHVAADPDLVFSILTDYDSCARVFRNVVASETILTPDGDKQVLQVSYDSSS